MRADVVMRDKDEMRKGLLEIQVEGRQHQGRFEASIMAMMASLNDLIKQRQKLTDSRLAETSAVMRRKRPPSPLKHEINVGHDAASRH